MTKATAAPLSIGNALSAGWKLTWKNFGFLLGVFFVILGIALAVLLVFFFFIGGSALLADNSTSSAAMTGMVLLSVFMIPAYAAAIIGITVIGIGMLKIIINITSEKERSIRDLFTNWNYLLTYLAANMLYTMIVYAGFAFFIIPAFIWGIKYQFALHLILDKDMDVRAAFDKSAAMTEGKKFTLFLYTIVLSFVAMAGFIVFGIGAFISIPMVYIAWTHIYKQLLGEAK